MIKKALKILTTMGVLIGAYVGYVQLFAVVHVWLKPATPYIVVGEAEEKPSRTALEASELARQQFGEDHWSVNAPWRYYNVERGYWMYAKEYERKNEGKQLKLRPFAIIWRSKDGKTIKTVTANEAVADFDQPFDSVKPGSKSGHVMHAEISGDVKLRDDKGTPANRADDLLVSKLTYIEFDEKSLQIRSESDLVIADGQNMTAEATGLVIELRPQESPGRSGFNGAKTAYLLRNVHIHMLNVGRTGILPGANPSSGDDKTPTPLDLRCTGRMKVSLPDPQPAPKPGDPPPQPQPTLVWFYRNVQVKRGTDKPDQLDADELYLTLVPAAKPPSGAAPAGGAVQLTSAKGTPALKQGGAKQVQQVAAAEPPPGSSAAPETESAKDPSQGSFGDLTLRRAIATGHAVWLQSEAQNMRALGNQLIHEKFPEQGRDKTYFLGNSNSKVVIVKTEYFEEGPDKGKVREISTIHTVDVALFQDIPPPQAPGAAGAPNRGKMTIIARGAGDLETRNERTGPVIRSASWHKQAEVLTEGQGDAMRRILILSGNPQLADRASVTLNAHDEIKVCLKPTPKPKQPPAQPALASAAQASDNSLFNSAPGSSSQSQKSGTGSFQIEWLQAKEDAQLEQVADEAHPTAAHITMNVRDELDVEFPTPQPPEPAPGQSQPPALAANAPASEAAAAQQPKPEQVADEKEEKKAEPKPAQPPVDIKANHVWARVLQQPGAKGKGEVQEARLRGAVSFHQDPPEGKTQGTDASGDKADVNSQGEGRFLVVLDGAPRQLAQVWNQDFHIQAERRIHLDQTANFAWVEGRGALTQMVNRGLLNDGGLAENTGEPGESPKAEAERAAKAAAKGSAKDNPPRERVPMVVTWRERMEFHGQTRDEQGDDGPAKADFFGDVHAITDDAHLTGDHLETFMDQTVSFTRLKPDPNAEKDPQPQPKAQVAFVRCTATEAKHKVIAVNTKRDPVTRKLIEKQWIEGKVLTYDKASGEFNVPGPGLVRLYSVKGEGQGAFGGLGAGAAQPNRAGANSRAGGSTAATRTASSTGSRPTAGASQKTADAKPDAAKPLELTRVRFSKEMRGRFGSGRDTSSASPRQADFFGDIEVLHGPVRSDENDLDPDHRPLDSVYLTSQFLRVVSEPPPKRSKEPAHTFLNALENAQAENKDAQGLETTIQGDQITYDSAKKLFYAYGLEGRKVQFARQNGPGMGHSDGGGDSFMYNLATGQSDMQAPLGFRIIDKVGTRAADIKPAEPKPPKRPPRRNPKMPPRSDKDRQGMRGR